MPVLLAICNFLTSTYMVGGTSYGLKDVMEAVDNIPASPVVDAEGLACSTYDSTTEPFAIGPLLSQWLSLYNSSGFTCIMSHSTVASGAGNKIIPCIDGATGPSTGDYAGLLVDVTAPTQLIADGYSICSSPITNPGVGARENCAWQLGLVECAISTNGSLVSSGFTVTGWPAGSASIFYQGSCPMHVQWIGLYDQTIDISWLPYLSAPGTVPPPNVPSGPHPGGPGSSSRLGGGGVIRRRSSSLLGIGVD